MAAIISTLISLGSLWSGSLYDLSHNIAVHQFNKKDKANFNSAPVLALILLLQVFTYFLSIRLYQEHTDLLLTSITFIMQFSRLISMLRFLDINREIDIFKELTFKQKLLDVTTNSFSFAHTLLLFI